MKLPSTTLEPVYKGAENIYFAWAAISALSVCLKKVGGRES
jgi:hypothetical protein